MFAQFPSKKSLTYIWYSEGACRIIDFIMIWLYTSSLTPPLQKPQVSHLLNLQIEPSGWPNLWKYDYISIHHNNLNWLPISYQIKLRSFGAISCYYFQKRYLLFDPPVLYGWWCSYQTHCREHFASVDLYCLASTKRHFCFASHHLLDLPTSVHNHDIKFMKAVKKYYMDDSFG